MHGQNVEPRKAGERVLLRVFCHAYGAKVVLLLNGYGANMHITHTRQGKRRIECPGL